MKDPYKSDNRNYQQKQSYADVERERYLAKLKGKSDRRSNNKILHDMALAVGEEHAAKRSKKHLGAIAKRTEFRAHLKKTWIESHKTHEEMHRKLGQLYRQRLVWFVGRSLEDAATVRTEFESHYQSRQVFELNSERQSPVRGDGQRHE